jgi:hypothetical protein
VWDLHDPILVQGNDKTPPEIITELSCSRLLAEQATDRIIVKRLTEPIALTLRRQSGEESVAVVAIGKVQSDQGASNPFAGVPVVEITETGFAAHPLIEKLVQGSGAFVELELQEGRGGQ